jgi:hypothetical protein
MKNIAWGRPGNAWVKRRNGLEEIVRVVPDLEKRIDVSAYKLYVAYGAMGEDVPDERNPDFLGRILFDAQGYWIYDGEPLSIVEQEQVARFIMNYKETY